MMPILQDEVRARHVVDKAVVTRGFEQLGPERVAQALDGRETTGRSWATCFVAQAFGPEGALCAELDRRGALSKDGDVFATVADIVGVDRDAVAVLSDAHSDPTIQGTQDTLYALAAEWLETARPASVT